MLEITGLLLQLRRYKSFEKLVQGFRNPKQSSATLFEARVASWCASRSISTSLEFGPDVEIKGKQKHPEFLWETTLGKLYVECKRANLLQNNFVRRFSRLLETLNRAYEKYKPWPDSVRLDVVIEGPALNGIEDRLEYVTARSHEVYAKEEQEEIEVTKGEVSARIVPQHKPSPPIEDCAQSGAILVGLKPTPVSSESAHSTLTVSLGSHRARVAAKLVRDAQTQFPRGTIGAVFIEIGSNAIVSRRIEKLLASPIGQQIPWVGVCSQKTSFVRFGEKDSRLTGG